MSAATGTEMWSISLPGPLWASPVVIDGVLLMGDCAGVFHAFELQPRGARPAELWSLELGGCIEATPAVWDGRILIGSRDGALYAITEGAEPAG